MSAGETDGGHAGREPGGHAGQESGGRLPVGVRFREYQARRGRGDGPPADEPGREFRSYYGRPILKAPVWKRDIPAYFFTGGLAAGSSMLAAGADLTGRPAMRRATRLASLAAMGASTYFLIHDLGRPNRFHHMLRIAKPTSPMSMGTWILALFGPASGIAAVAEVAPALPRRGVLGLARRALPVAGTTAGYLAAAVAPAVATYTAVLIADTAVPSWHEAYPQLPFVFAGSALASASGVALLAAPLAETGPASRLAVAGAAMELVASHRVENAMGIVSEPYRQGRAGRLLRAARGLTVAGAAGAVLGRRSRLVSALSGAALVAAAALTRFGVFEGGVASAKDPKYTVVPQRQRVEESTGAR
ncbi:NrfD/PsrC family molybdoenzyme membrane anchor subunit [Rugosimonospora africana]|uniref:Polysulfide reductase n=1 Tax=Rugosimonospora africana TaxID=556532 RepID=A0A8J3VUD5_9ACTN|nr:NrfD/PsrC family molybdoenzyme membrane anchor subunit [Rugosimonospora africana]GIH18508.1 polysulfide reductase [Rugosimonospora africana]